LNFRIYLRRFGKLIRISKFRRNPQGLYVIRDGHGVGGSYDTYHEDGKSWSHVAGIKPAKYIRQPLSSFSGTETLSVAMLTVLGPMPRDRDEMEVTVKPEDIVINLEGNVAIEVILSSSTQVPLPDLPERINRQVYVKSQWKPALIVEVFQPLNNTFPTGRFPRTEAWVEGVNFFPDHRGRL
jgi:hypothetical protein